MADALIRRRIAPPHTGSGQMLLEAIIVVALLAVVSSSILVLLTGQISNVTRARNSAHMLLLAEEGLEAARAIRDADWDALVVGTHGLSYQDGAWSFSGTSDTADGATRTVTVTEVAPNERKVEVALVWDEQTQWPRTFSVTSVLTNWRNVAEEESGELEGDWGDPQFIDWSYNFGSGFRGIAVDIVSDRVYLAGFGLVSNNKELYVIDVANPLSPEVLGSINISAGINEVAVNDSDTYAFVANASKTTQLQVINVSNPNNLSVAAQLSLSGNNNTGRSLDLVGNMLYLGTEGPASPGEFYVIDVTNPTSPVVRSKATVGNDINDVMAYGSYAYCASDVDARELTIMDVADPYSASVEAYMDLPGSSDAEGLYIDGPNNRVYVARKTDHAGIPEVVAIDVSNPSNPQIVGSLQFNVDVQSLYAVDNYLFVVVQEDEEFMVFDASDPSDMRYVGGIDFGTGDIPTDIILKDNIFYVSVFDSDGLRIVTAY